MRCSGACHPTRGLGVPRIVLTALHVATALGLPYGQGSSVWASITASATFGRPAWRKGSPDPQFFKDLDAFTWDVVCWGGRRHDQGQCLPS